MRRTLCAAIASTLLAVLLSAQNTPPTKYKTIKGYPPEKIINSINEAADQGYRSLFTVPFSIMRLDATPPDTYRYLPSPAGGASTMLNALNQQGALGYRLCGDTGMLEKSPHPRNYEYTMPSGFSGKALESSRQSLIAQGWEPVGGIVMPAILVREIGTTAPAHPARPVRVVDALRKGKAMKTVSELAADGYRYDSEPVSHISGGRAIAMVQCDPSCGGPFEYRSFDVKDAAQLERELNALGHDGFRVLPKTLDFEPYLVERSANHSKGFEYRVLDASDAATTEKLLNEADRDGFIPIGVVAHTGWTVHCYIVMEKSIASASSTP